MFFRTESRSNIKSTEEYILDPDSRAQCLALEENVKEFGVAFFGVKNRRQGINFFALVALLEVLISSNSRNCTCYWSGARVYCTCSSRLICLVCARKLMFSSYQVSLASAATPTHQVLNYPLFNPHISENLFILQHTVLSVPLLLG